MPLNISQYKEAISLCRKAGNPLMVWGPYGIGKSEGAEQYAKEHKMGFISIEAPLYNPEDIVGIPDRDGDRTIFLRPNILPTKGEIRRTLASAHASVRRG